MAATFDINGVRFVIVEDVTKTAEDGALTKSANIVTSFQDFARRNGATIEAFIQVTGDGVVGDALATKDKDTVVQTGDSSRVLYVVLGNSPTLDFLGVQKYETSIKAIATREADAPGRQYGVLMLTVTTNNGVNAYFKFADTELCKKLGVKDIVDHQVLPLEHDGKLDDHTIWEYCRGALTDEGDVENDG